MVENRPIMCTDNEAFKKGTGLTAIQVNNQSRN
jgi:hypothetical protein